MGWLITLGILALLAGMPLGVSVCYDSAGVLVKVIAGFLRIQVVPSKSKSGEKDQKEKHTKSGAMEKKAVKQTNAQNQKKRGNRKDSQFHGREIHQRRKIQ